jgi:hypothetical protein
MAFMSQIGLVLMKFLSLAFLELFLNRRLNVFAAVLSVEADLTWASLD